MSLTITIMHETNGQWDGGILDRYTVPGDVVEIRLSAGCEMVFVMADGREVASTDDEIQGLDNESRKAGTK